MSQKKVSILIPTFNSEKYIAETIESALNQTYKYFEIILVDNASSDNTWQIIEEYKKDNSSIITSFRNDENRGPIRNWMKCIELATGIYGKIVWSDDLIELNFLEKTVPILEENDDVGFVFSPAVIFGDVKKEKWFYTSEQQSGLYSTQKYIEGILFDKDYPNSPANGLFRLKDLEKNLMLRIPNKFDSDASIHAIGNDLLLYLLTAKDYKKYAYIDDTFAKFRAHGDSITISTKKSKMVLNYDIAKAYFVDNFVDDENLIKRFNGILWLHNKIFTTSSEIYKFYFRNKNFKINFYFLMFNFFSKNSYIKRVFRKFM